MAQIVECAPRGGHLRSELFRHAGPSLRRFHDQEKTSAAQHRQEARDRRSLPERGALHALSKHHDVCRNLIRIWIGKYERGEYDDDAVEADLVPEYEARIAALERLVGRQALEIEFLKEGVNGGGKIGH